MSKLKAEVFYDVAQFVADVGHAKGHAVNSKNNVCISEAIRQVTNFYKLDHFRYMDFLSKEVFNGWNAIRVNDQRKYGGFNQEDCIAALNLAGDLCS